MSTGELCTAMREGMSSLYQCSPSKEGKVRIATPFLYPDGDIVEVFIVPTTDGFVVTDYGESLGWLRMQSSRQGKLSPKQQSLLDDVCLTLGVEFDHGQLSLRCDRIDEIPKVVQRLGQAAVRVSDLWFTFRTRAVEALPDEVGDWLSEQKFSFERGVQHSGRSGREWKIDFEVSAAAQTALVFLLSTGSRAASRSIAEHVLAGCVDLHHLTTAEPACSFIALFDDTADVWREEEFRLVETHSSIARWSRPDQLRDLLGVVA